MKTGTVNNTSPSHAGALAVRTPVIVFRCTCLAIHEQVQIIHPATASHTDVRVRKSSYASTML